LLRFCNTLTTLSNEQRPLGFDGQPAYDSSSGMTASLLLCG
jgi:hypothetical protein